MNILTCKHCGGKVKTVDTLCPHCGIPLPVNRTRSRHRFILWFIALLVFSVFMMFWLPPDWSRFMDK